jgi:N-acetylmuramoyl-L-alanine amidase
MEEDNLDAKYGTAGKGDYVVAQGDCMNSISEAHGFFWETLWDLPENKELKQARQDPNVLYPGDQLTIPPLRLKEAEATTDKRHRFKRKGVPARLVMQFYKGQKPRANEDYVLVIDGDFRRGKTNGDGYINEILPNGAHAAKVVFSEGSKTEEYEITLGGLNPYDSLTGVQARLTNLGYSIPQVDGRMDSDTIQALKQFQQTQGLKVTGELNDETCTKLRDLHGS